MSERNPADPSACQAAARALREARHVVVSTGAGMSAESGVPTFRDAQTGLWANFRAEDLATPEAFQRDPVHVWGWYRLRRRMLADIEPHDGHRVLATWERRLPRMTIVTQNVDGLHHRAGSHTIFELHGRLDVARCTSCPRRLEGLEDLGEDPRCDECGARLRPGVVWFGELLPQDQFEAALAAAEQCDLYFVIGTSGMVEPAASITRHAAANQARIVEINPTSTSLSEYADICIRDGCGAALRRIDAAWRS